VHVWCLYTSKNQKNHKQKSEKLLQKLVEIPFPFYFLLTIVMKVLIWCAENPKIFIEVLDELQLFIDKRVSAVCQQIL
jgi:Na+/citrate or Na+/malate symporter